MLTDKFIFRIHRILGLAAGLFIILLTLTGSLLVFDNQVDAWLNPDVTKVVPGTTRQPVDALLTAVRRQHPNGTLLNLRLYAGEPGRAVRAELQENKNRIWVYLNPYTGVVLGTREESTSFIHQVRELHENLLIPPLGGYIMGLVGLCLLGSVLTGVWYYRKSLLSVFSIGVRWKKSSRIVYADLHKYLGVVALLFMTLMGVTGVFFHWEQIERAFGDQSKATNQPALVPTVVTVDAYLAQSQRVVPGFVAEMIDFPNTADKPLILRGNTPGSSRMLGQFTTSVEYNTITGRQQTVFRAEEADLEYQMEHIFEELHFGRFGGWVTQTLWIFFAFSTAVVTVTGLLIWWIKR